MDYCIGNGQLMQLRLMPLVGALNCMHDQQAVLKCGGVLHRMKEKIWKR